MTLKPYCEESSRRDSDLMNSVPLRLDERGRSVNPFICSSSQLASALREACDWFTGVPDSMFQKVQPLLAPYLTSPRENHAIASAFGGSPGGKETLRDDAE